MFKALKILSFHTKPGFLFCVISDFLTTNETQAKKRPCHVGFVVTVKGAPRVSGWVNVGFKKLHSSMLHIPIPSMIHGTGIFTYMRKVDSYGKCR